MLRPARTARTHAPSPGEATTTDDHAERPAVRSTRQPTAPPWTLTRAPPHTPAEGLGGGVRR
ncbi:hypothetical protein, partial [Streptomyces caniscabiei]|uniref:hypothetical protein n=1 Tax=Streptomyces caniscabiei TaxID=2746961 RepID=UPI001C4FAE2E